MAIPDHLATDLTVGDPLPAALNEERTAINELGDDVQTRIASPGGKQTGDLLRWDGTAWVTTQTRLFEGNGDPNGKFAAPIGSRYVDMTAANGIVEWIKTADDGANTGWTVSGANMTVKNTGRRNFASLITVPAGAAIYSAVIQRFGDVVDVYLDLKMPTAAQDPWAVIAALPGFGPGYDRYGALSDNKEAAANGSRIDSDGGIYLYSTVPGKRDRFAGTWITHDAWPTGSQLPPAV